MADFRYGFFVRPNNKKIESNLEEKSNTNHISDPKSKPARVDAEPKRQPTAVILLGMRHITTTTEKYTEKVYSSTSRDDFQQHEGNWNLRPAINHSIEFNKLIAKSQKEARQPRHEMSLSEPMNDIGKAMEYLKEAINLHSAKNNNACSASDHSKKDSCTKTIDSKEAARRYGKSEAPASVSGANNVATINCKEAARKYKGTIV